MAGRKSKLSKSETVQVSISTNMILKVVLILLGVVLIYLLKNIVAILLLSLLLAALIDPFAIKLQRKNIPRGIAVAIVYFIIVLLGFLLAWLVLPVVFEQTISLVSENAALIEQATGTSIDIAAILNADLLRLDVNSIVQTFQENGLADAMPKVIEIAADFFTVMITLLLIFVLAFYMVVEESALKKGVDRLTPERYQKYLLEIVPELRKKVGAWLHGQLALMFIIFLLSYISLLIIGVPYALVLAIIAGTLEIVPFLGPILSVIPALIIALSLSPLHALIVAAVFFLIQQLEGEVLTPKIMQKAIGLNPVVSIVAILIGYELASIPGAILAIPFAMVIGVFAKEWFRVKERLN